MYVRFRNLNIKRSCMKALSAITGDKTIITKDKKMSNKGFISLLCSLRRKESAWDFLVFLVGMLPLA